MMLTTAAVCMAANIYFEARGEHTLGQLMVAQVTMNRAGGDPKRVCDVVHASKQYSWTIDCVQSRKLRAHCAPVERAAWAHAEKIAATALSGRMRVLTCADHYTVQRMTPPVWARQMKVVMRFEGHVFYASRTALSSCEK